MPSIITSTKMSISKRPSDYTGTIDLSDSHKERNQMIYASQLYGTFFAIYAYFEAESTNNPLHKKINRIQFNIINYKGPLDIGISEIKYYVNNRSFEIKVRALIDPLTQHEIVFSNGLLVKKEEEILFLRNLEPLSSKSGDKNKYHVFDSEFYARDGILTIPKIRHEELSLKQIVENLDVPENKSILTKQKNNLTKKQIYPYPISIPKAYGPRCVPSVAKIIF